MSATRIWMRRLVLALLAVAALYLGTANLFLNTPLASWAINRRPERLQVTWRSAWSLWPGRVEARGLAVRGHQRSVRWWVTAERADGFVDVPGLFGRRFEVRDLRGDGVRSSVLREPPPQPPAQQPPKPRAGGPRRRGWTVRLPEIVLTDVREIRYGDYLLSGSRSGSRSSSRSGSPAGAGRATGGFWLVVGGDFQLQPSSLEMSGARLDRQGRLLVRDAAIRAEVRMGPYAPRLHPGMEGWDFLSGRLEARGRVPDPPLLDRLGNAAGGAGDLVMDVRAERGVLLPGSRMAIAPRPGRGEAPLRVAGSVARGPAGPVLFLTLQAAGLALQAAPDRPPFFQADAVDLAASSSEVRLRRLFSAARQLRRARTVSTPLAGDVHARGVRLDLRGSRLASRISFDQAEGRIDLPALLARRLILDDLRAQGGSIHVDLAAPAKTVPGAPPWSVDLAGARFEGLREIGFDQFVLAGDSRVETTVTLEAGGPLAVDTLVLETRGGSLLATGETVARRVGVQARGNLAPLVVGELAGSETLRFVSGTVDLRGSISSLGFLASYFRSTPWLDLRGNGDLSLGLRVQNGRLVSGTTVALRAPRLEARVLDSLATGVATVSGSVQEGREGADGRFVVRFDRFDLQSLRLRGRPTYIRGRGLSLTVTSRSSVDLTAPVEDLRAVVDLPPADVPDLRVFNPYLPPDAGIAIRGGRGRARLHWDLDGATKSGRGEAHLSSQAARLRFQGLEIGGAFALAMPLVTNDLESRRFELAGTELSLAGVSYRDTTNGNGNGAGPGTGTDWWARLELSQGSVVWEEPLRLRGTATVAMKNADPLLLLFAPRRQFLRWFQGALGVENIVARGSFRLEGDALVIPALQANGGSLELRSRMLFSKSRRWGDLLVQYGRLVTGIELRDGQRSFKLRRPREWYESGSWLR